MLFVPFSRQRRRGFTLIEMLVAISVLALLAVLTSQMVASVASMVRGGESTSDNFTKARSTLATMARDIEAGVFRPDLAAFTDANGDSPNGTNPCCFYTRRPGEGTGLRNLSLVSYQLLTTGTLTGTLQRGAMPISWNSSPSLISFNTLTSIPNSSSITLENMVSGVMRMEFYFVDGQGILYKQYVGQAQTNRTRAVGITLVVVDQASLSVLSSTQLTQLATTGTSGVFPDDPNTNPTESLKGYWEGLVSAPGFFNGYPEQLRAGLHIYERYVTLPVN